MPFKGYAYDSGSTSEVSDSSNIGILLLSCSILCDAIVPNFQQRLMQTNEYAPLPTNNDSSQQHDGLSALALMFNMNSIGFTTLIMYLLLTTKSSQLVNVSSLFLLYLSIIGLSLSIAVLAYTKLIKMSNSVVAVATSTLRKVVTVVLSYIIFPKQLLPIHFISGLFVLVGLILSSKLVKK